MRKYMTTLLLLVIALFCGTSFAIRLPFDFEDDAKIYIFDSPLYHPISEVALGVNQFLSVVPTIVQSLQQNESQIKALNIAKNLSRVKPSLESIISLAVTPQAADSSNSINSKQLEEAFSSLRNMLAQAHRDAVELTNNHPVFVSSTELLLDSIQNALLHASSLSPTFVPTVYRVHPMMEKFIVHDYFPQAEKVYTIKMKLDSVRKNPSSEDAHKTIEDLSQKWDATHNQLKESSVSLLKLLDALKTAIYKNANAKDLKRLAAFVSLLNVNDASDKFLNLDLNSLTKRLNRLERNLLAVAHRKNPIVQKNKDKIAFPAAISMLYRIEPIVEKLNQLHDEIHSTEEKFKYIVARLKKSKNENRDAIIKNNNAIRFKLNKLRNDIDAAHRSLRTYMTQCLTSETEKDAPHIDFMTPMLRFSELEKKIKGNTHSERFLKDLEGIRQQLQKLHTDAYRSQRFAQTMKARKTKLITE